MATLRVIVSAQRRYWCAGRCFEAGDTEVVLEDRPDSSIEQQLAQLDAAKGGAKLQASELDRGNPPERAPGVLTYRIVLDEAPSPPELLAAAEAYAEALAAASAVNRSSSLYAPPEPEPESHTNATESPPPGEATTTEPSE